MEKDTSVLAAPEGTPADAGTQTPAPEQAPAVSDAAPKEGKPAEEKVYAGKYKSIEDLEKAYKEVETKVGAKSYAEKIGDNVVQATGYSIGDLENAGYSPEQIVQAVVSYQETGKQQSNQFDVQAIRQNVESSKVDDVKFDIQLERYLRKNPEAEEYEGWIRKMRKHPDFRSSTVEAIVQDIKPLMEKAQQEVLVKQGEKEQAVVSVSHNQAPEPQVADKATDAYLKNPSQDNAVAMLKARGFQ